MVSSAIEEVVQPQNEVVKIDDLVDQDVVSDDDEFLPYQEMIAKEMEMEGSPERVYVEDSSMEKESYAASRCVRCVGV